MVTSFDTYADALESTGADGHAELPDMGLTVCGVCIAEDVFKYFVASTEQDDEEYHHMAFEVREGRPPSEAELWYRDQAKRMRASA